MLIRKRRKNMLILICSSILAVFSLAFFFKFLKADGDFTLMSRKQVKREEIEDKVVWITGASRGIGEVLARQVASFGAKLIISARNEVELERVKKNLTGKHAPDEVMILPLDLSQGEEHLREAVQKAESCFGDAGVDYMFHNAAYERPKTTALDVTEESLKATFDVNVLGPISLTRLLAPHMLKRGSGHFVVMSSAAGKAPAPGQAVYSASKFAVNGYFHTLRSELYTRGIKVTVVYPGPVMTSTSEKSSSEKRVSSERCAELTIIAATHSLKEAWISHQRDKRRRKQEEKISGLESESDFDLILDLEGPDWNGVNQGYVWVVFILFVIFTRWAIIFLRPAHPVLAVMYLMQYIPTVGYWLMDKIGAKRVETAAQKGNTYSINLLFGKNKAH